MVKYQEGQFGMSITSNLDNNFVRDAFLSSGLSRQILSKVWGLSDRDKDGQLSQEEFIIGNKAFICNLFFSHLVTRSIFSWFSTSRCFTT